MAKKEIIVSIKNDEGLKKHQTTAIISENTIEYKEKDNTTVVFDYNRKTLTRDNEELKMNYEFSLNKKTTGTILIKELNKTLNLEIQTKKMIVENDDIEINFVVENNKFLYKIEVIK